MIKNEMAISAKQVLYTILLNSDTEQIVDEYVLGYLKTHPELLTKYYNPHPWVEPIKEQMKREFRAIEPKSPLDEDQLNAFVVKCILWEFIHHDTELTPSQTNTLFSILTEKQMCHVASELEKGKSWF